MEEKVKDRRQIQLIELDMLLEMDRICTKNDLQYYLAYGTVLGAVRHGGFIPWDTDIDIIVPINNYDQFCNIVHKELSNKYFLNSIETDNTYESLKARISLRDEFHHKIHIDIFPIVGVPNSSLGRKIFSKVAYFTYRAFFIKKVNPNINYKEKHIKKMIAFVAKLLLLPIPSEFFVWIFKKLSLAFPIEDSDFIYNFCGSYGDKELIPKDYLSEPVKMIFEGYEFPVPKEWDKYLSHFYGNYTIPIKYI